MSWDILQIIEWLLVTRLVSMAEYLYQLVHAGERGHVCEQPGCGKSFGQKGTLVRHARLRHRAVPQPQSVSPALAERPSE